VLRNVKGVGEAFGTIVKVDTTVFTYHDESQRDKADLDLALVKLDVDNTGKTVSYSNVPKDGKWKVVDSPHWGEVGLFKRLATLCELLLVGARARVTKYGQATGRTYGYVSSLGQVGTTVFSDPIGYSNHIMAVTSYNGQAFAGKGDSGAAVVLVDWPVDSKNPGGVPSDDKAGSLIGIVYSEAATSKNCEIIPWKSVFQFLDEGLGEKQWEFKDNQEEKK